MGSDLRSSVPLVLPKNFNPRPPRGERLGFMRYVVSLVRFQSTPPAWGATLKEYDSLYRELISIHAPRVGSDLRLTYAFKDCSYFNPRPPRGERRAQNISVINLFVFQSTPPAWGATQHTQSRGADRKISIHAPRVGSDFLRLKYKIRDCNFNPRPPRGERLAFERPFGIAQKFQSTPPAWGATRIHAVRCFLGKISIHAPRVGSDP